MAESWYKEYCPQCEAINWVSNGDETDITAIDVEAIKCRQCGHIFMLGEEDNIMMEVLGYESAEDANWELGLEKPD